MLFEHHKVLSECNGAAQSRTYDKINLLAAEDTVINPESAKDLELTYCVLRFQAMNRA